MCRLGVEVVGPNLVLLLSEPSLGPCGLHGNEHAIGLLAWNNASLGMGVVSAAVGTLGTNGGWTVTLFDAIKTNPNSSELEWRFESGGCWFELHDLLGANQSEIVISKLTE